MSFIPSDVWDALEKHCQRGKPFYPEVVADLVEVAIKRGRELEETVMFRSAEPNAWGHQKEEERIKKP